MAAAWTAFVTRFFLAEVHVCELWHGPTLAFKGDQPCWRSFNFFSCPLQSYFHECRPILLLVHVVDTIHVVEMHTLYKNTQLAHIYNRSLVSFSQQFLKTIPCAWRMDEWMAWQTLECKFSLGFFRCVTYRERRRIYIYHVWEYVTMLYCPTHPPTTLCCFTTACSSTFWPVSKPGQLSLSVQGITLSLASIYFDVCGIHLDLLFNSKICNGLIDHTFCNSSTPKYATDSLNIHFGILIYLQAVILVLPLLRLAVALIISVHCTLFFPSSSCDSQPNLIRVLSLHRLFNMYAFYL